jgi:hypothetical protein
MMGIGIMIAKFAGMGLAYVPWLGFLGTFGVFLKSLGRALLDLTLKQIVCIVIFVSIAFVIGDVRGVRKTKAKWAAADIAMQQRAVERDKTINAKIDTEVEKRLKPIIEENERVLNKKVSDYEKTLRSKGDQFRLSDPDARGLQRIERSRKR